MKIYTADKETGTFIEEFDSIKKANDAIVCYEVEDEKEGVFEPDFYDIVNENHESIMEEITSNTNKSEKYDTCCFCGAKMLPEESHNPYPVRPYSLYTTEIVEGRCCSFCNQSIVLPARMEEFRKMCSWDNEN